MTDMTKVVHIDPVAYAAMQAAQRAGTWKPTWQDQTRETLDK